MAEEHSTICPVCWTETPVTTEYVMLWLKCAEADAREAKRSKSATHALYWTQQSVEKQVKAQLLSFGGCYCDAVGVGHESLRGFVKVMSGLVQDPQLRDLVDALTDSDSQQRIGNLQSQLGDEELRSGIALWPPEALEFLLGIVYKLEDERKSLLSKAVRSGVIEYKSRTQLSELLRRAIPDRLRSRTDVEETLARIQSMLGICEHQLSGQEFSFSANSIEIMLRWGEANVRLYVLASATYPHATSSRYPAHPLAPDDIQQAAMFKLGESGKAKRMGRIGIQHYSNRIGVIYYVRRLAGEAETTAKSMQQWLRSMDSENLQPLPKCEECENSTHF